MNKSVFIICVFCIGIFSSCVPKKKIIYFQNDTINQENVSNSYQTIFKPDDLLQITITAEDLEAVKPFNLPAVAISTVTNSPIGTPQNQLYLINSNGEIDFPVLGMLKIGGLTKEAAIELLKSKLDPAYVKSPNINVRITNFKVTVLGDVLRPGTYTIPNERISVLEAIGLSGDLNISGERAEIIVKREEGDKKVTYVLDLLSNKIFTSPAYYLQQNDVVYVKPNNAKIQSASFNQNTGLFVSIASILISLITVIAR